MVILEEAAELIANLIRSRLFSLLGSSAFANDISFH